VAALNRIRDPELGSPMAWMYGAVDTITATGDREVTIALKRPWTLFRYVPATAAAHIVPAALIAAGDDTLDLAPVGTGPYRFASWEPGKIGLNRHDGYWQDGVPFFAEVVFEAVDSDDDRIGRLDEISIGGLTPDFLTEAQFTSIPTTGDPDGGSDISVLETTGHFSLFVALRCDTAPFADAELRRAFARAIDTDAVVAATIGPTGVCGVNSTVPPNVLAPCSNAGRLKPVSHDPKKAREVVKRVAPGGFSTTLTVLDEEPWREIGKAIAAQIEQTLGDQDQGVRVTVQRLQYHDYQLRVRLSDYDGMLLATWAPDFPDASANLRPLFHSGGQPVAPNLFRYSNPEVDRLLDLAHQGDDVQDRCSQLIKAQRLIAADQPYVLIDHLKWFLPLVGNLSGYTFGPLWFWDAFLRTLTRSTGGEPRVSSPTPEDCDKYLSELILWNGSLAKRTVELSAIVVHPSGKTGVMKGTFAESAATVDGRIGIETTASWYDDPATRTEWTNPDTKVHVAISTPTDDKQGRVEVALEDVGAPTLSLRLIRCDAGPLAAAGFVPGSGETEEAIYLLSFLKDGPPPIPIIH